ncbi:non-hydrolyzing UDP-N-acetylglucosamine 2-epimerase [Aestuariirhabdus haliotis]|uniref:non-hydrolyzing UDP-N-acetylglucosamine 2-epimerase n=1 Tax=Aestuariirhabdus haliotis TaxID=2918751 RepID=UPI0020C061AB|nr:UDP-N-acetylglucosamine 2-epimerase (non-hydrolyzing) [Aestuariirhabdus haliotis]MCL6419724.1 UDP-N-acetylglucosamine 2-epimerase (non-hydrolyzing) [Aestuariirhabdus haliotis]
MTILGARPQFIKAATVSRAIARVSKYSEVIVHTGQHYDSNMSDVFFSELEIPKPAYNLGVGGGSHGQNTGRMLEEIEKILLQEKPSIVLVYGDTDSTLAGALAAVKTHIPIVHVEAGLRSFNRRMPEEINRVLTDHMSDLLLTPTEQAISNLSAEGIVGRTVVNVGDVMFDAALYFGQRAELESDVMDKYGLVSKQFYLATVHRQENTDDEFRLKKIFEGFSKIDQPVVLPLHPRTKNSIHQQDIELPSNIHIIDPQGYIDMVMLEKNACVIVTDSGGIQKEAYFHGVPCVTLRDETEWVELVDMGWNRLASPVDDDFVSIFAQSFRGGQEGLTPYGSGTAAEQVVSALDLLS